MKQKSHCKIIIYSSVYYEKFKSIINSRSVLDTVREKNSSSGS